MQTDDANTINALERRLSHLAMNWRSFHSRHRFDDAEKAVLEYHRILSELWNLGWDGGDLPPDAELPDELMPKYYLDKWRHS
jgi:hypothetical protein